MDRLTNRRTGIFVASALAILICGQAAMAVSVTLTPSAQDVMASWTCTVDVYIADLVSPGMEALELTLTYDPDLLDVSAVTAGPLLTGLGEPLWENLDTLTDGFIYAVATLGSASSTGSGVALTITFLADSVNTGISPIDFTAILLEPSEPYGSGGEIAHTQSTGDTITVVPEPATLALLISGLAALAGLKRRK